jgi:hypothetical protein
MREKEAQAFTQASKLQFTCCVWEQSLAIHYKTYAPASGPYSACGQLVNKSDTDPLKVNCRYCIETMRHACVVWEV